MAVLLKTTLVRVSSIQIMKVRVQNKGKSVWKIRYIGDVSFGQLDIFILQWDEVLCNGFDLAVLDPCDRRGTDTYVSLPLRVTGWGLFLHK